MIESSAILNGSSSNFPSPQRAAGMSWSSRAWPRVMEKKWCMNGRLFDRTGPTRRAGGRKRSRQKHVAQDAGRSVGAGKGTRTVGHGVTLHYFAQHQAETLEPRTYDPGIPVRSLQPSGNEFPPRHCRRLSVLRRRSKETDQGAERRRTQPRGARAHAGRAGQYAVTRRADQPPRPGFGRYAHRCLDRISPARSSSFPTTRPF